MLNHLIHRAAERWWVQVPASLRRVSPFLSAAWADGIYLTAWPRVAALLPLLALLLGLVEGATHWSFYATMWDAHIVPQRAVAFVQIRLLLWVAAVIGALSAQLGLLLVAGFALGDWFLAGPAFYFPPLSFFWHFLQIGVPRLIDYLLFFMLVVQPVLAAQVLTSSLRWPNMFSGRVRFWTMAVLSAALQGFMVSAWTYAAPMAIRPIWMWAWHGEFPPLTISYFTTMVDPWLPGLTVAAALLRAVITWQVRQNAVMRDNAAKLAAAISQPGPRALTQYLPAWATALLAALTITLLAAGYMATFRLGLGIFIFIGALLLARAIVLPKIPGWPTWTSLMAAVPLLFRWLGVGVGTYLIAQAIYLRPASATVANTAAGAFAPELAGIALGLTFMVLLMPTSKDAPRRPLNLGRLRIGSGLKGAAVAIFFIVNLGHSSSAFAGLMAFCADSLCCFTSNRNAILAVAAFLLVVAALFILPEVLAAAGLAELLGIARVGLSTVETAEEAEAIANIVSTERVVQVLVENGVASDVAQEYAASFEGDIIERMTAPGEQWYRYTDYADSTGSFLTKTLFSDSQQAVDQLFLGPYGNTAAYIQRVTATVSSTVFDGSITNGGNAIRQTLVASRASFQYLTGNLF